MAMRKNTTSDRITNDTLIECKNGVMGPLIYKSNLNTGYVVEWSEFGEVQELEYRELVAMRGTQRKFFENNWILIEDAEVLRKLGVERYYKNALTTENFDSVFKMSADEIKTTVPNLSSGTKEAIRVKAMAMIKDGTFDSRSAIKALSEVLDCELEETE